MDITLLKEDQVWGDNALGVIKQAGTLVGATDLTIALGGVGIGYQLPDGTHSCAVWTASRDNYGGVLVDHYDGEQRWGSPYGRSLAVRPALPPSATSAIGSRNAATGGGLGAQYYGEYPTNHRVMGRCRRAGNGISGPNVTENRQCLHV